jgi:DegV family protein with EDD domain
MQKIAIVTDSTANLTPEMLKGSPVTVVPLKIIWNGVVLRDGVDISSSDFYARLVRDPSTPTTSQVTSEEFRRTFEELAGQFDAIYAPLLSSGISGTVDSALSAAKEFKKIPLEIFDSHETAGSLALLVMAVARLVKEGKSLQEVAAKTREIETGMHTYFMVDTLKYLHKGGRIGGASRFLGTTLGLKPILYMNKGKIDGFEKIRTQKKALARLLEIIIEKGGNSPCHINIMHADAKDNAEMAKNTLTEKLKVVEMQVTELSPVIGAHTGPGTLGICVYPD